MTLELKHLVGYLPYGLKFRVNLSDVQENYNNELREFTLTTANLDLLLGYGGKPILRPLSDLTKEIDGVVHLDIIKEIYPNVPNFYSLLRTKTLDLFALCDTIVEYCVVQYLFQHHFDVFSLIDNNLAIDINKIENE